MPFGVQQRPSDPYLGHVPKVLLLSNSNMKVAAHTTTKVHHFLSMACSLRCEWENHHGFVDIRMVSTMS